MELAALQRIIYNAIYEREDSEAAYQLIKGPTNLSASEGLAIYRSSIMGKLSRTLALTYPVSLKLVGEKFFNATAKVFITRVPSRSPDLGDFGKSFPDFLADFKPVISNLPYLPDVARLERHWHKVSNAKNSTQLDLKSLGEIPQNQWDNIVFLLPENSVFLESPYPIAKIWEVNQSDFQGDMTVNLEQGATKIFLWRGSDMHIDLPSISQWELLKLFNNQMPFGEVCKRIIMLVPDIDIPNLLNNFVQRGWIDDFYLKDT